MNDFARLFDISGLSLDRLRTFLRVVEAGNISKAAQGDSNRQSQYSRQIKELETFFGVQLTRLVGRRCEITEEGQRLALVIRRQFRELDDFREAVAGRSVNVRFGSQGSIIDWLLVPRLDAICEALGKVTVEMEQLRTLGVARAVADGRLDFGVLREDAVPKESKRWRLGPVGYALFAAKPLWRNRETVEKMLQGVPTAELLPGGQFGVRWQEWLAERTIRPRVIARVSSFTDLARVVQAGHAAAVLPEMAAVDFDPKKFQWEKIEGLKPRMLALVANARSLERVGLPPEVLASLSEWLSL